MATTATTSIGCGATDERVVTLTDTERVFRGLNFGVRCFDDGNVTASVTDGIVYRTTPITIEVNDANDVPVRNLASNLGLEIGGTNAGATVSAIVENEDGTYSATYMPTTVGVDSVYVSLNGAQIPGSPLRSNVTSDLRILTELLASSIEHEPGYSDSLRAAGGTAPYTWELASGQLPDGLTLDAATGLITGTPTVAGSYSLSVRGWNSTDKRGNGGDRTYTVNINVQAGAVAAPTITTQPRNPMRRCRRSARPTA
jgi:hypothetical protein